MLDRTLDRTTTDEAEMERMDLVSLAQHTVGRQAGS